MDVSFPKVCHSFFVIARDRSMVGRPKDHWVPLFPLGPQGLSWRGPRSGPWQSPVVVSQSYGNPHSTPKMRLLRRAFGTPRNDGTEGHCPSFCHCEGHASGPWQSSVVGVQSYGTSTRTETRDCFVRTSSFLAMTNMGEQPSVRKPRSEIASSSLQYSSQ